MQRVTITADDELVRDVDDLMDKRGYQNRSEAMRDLIRLGLKQWAMDEHSMVHCVGVLSYVYDHNARDLARRLTNTFHHSHNLVISSLHVHLDADMCLEISVLKGDLATIQHFAERVIAERSVRHGKLEVIPN